VIDAALSVRHFFGLQMSTAIDRLVDHVTRTGWEDLPAAAIESAKTFILDTVGAALAGAASTHADQVGATAGRWGAGDEATVIGSGLKLPAPAAALVNAFQAHSQEFDCVHDAAVVHAMTTALPAALAVAERRGQVSGRDLILAVVLGVDVAATIGLASRSRMRFFRPATAGFFGAAAAAGKLERLDRAALLDAFGLAYSQATGPMQAHLEGKPTLALFMGFAARGGIQAVDLAACGMPGPHDVLEGPYGYYKLIEEACDTASFAELGTLWRVTELSHKQFPTGRATHGGLYGILRLTAQHGFRADAVERVTLLAPPLINQLVARPWRADMSPSYARICFRYAAAVALSTGGVDLGDFTPERLADPHLRDLAARVEVVEDGNPDPATLSPQQVRVTLRSGTVHEITIDQPLGHPANPLSHEARLAKFRRCWAFVRGAAEAGAADRFIAMVAGLERLDDATEIAAALDAGARIRS
jgi:2-methylcitrate dehydratase PrpD